MTTRERQRHDAGPCPNLKDQLPGVNVDGLDQVLSPIRAQEGLTETPPPVVPRGRLPAVLGTSRPSSWPIDDSIVAGGSRSAAAPGAGHGPQY